jgi:serpin B
MFAKIFFSVLFVFSLSAFNCARDFSLAPSENIIRDLTSLEKQLIQSDNIFGLKLFREIVGSEPDTNIFISPLSVAMALGMTYNGAANETEEAMRQTLELGDLTKEQINQSFKSLIELLSHLDPKVIFEIANSIWYRNTFQVEQDFFDLNDKYFDAIVRSLDFSSPDAPDTINSWVDQKTNGKITEIIQEINPLTVMFLINAIYFKGTWSFEFDKEKTVDDQFLKPDGSQITCKMMVQANDFRYLETDDFQAIDLPYGDGSFSMTIFLPKPNSSLDVFVQKLTPENWNLWTSGLSTRQGIIYLPKFKLEYEITLNDVLKQLGMGVAFTTNADFSNINPVEDLLISNVKHKTFVEVDEQGTEAAAVTVVEISLTAADPIDSNFFMRIDRPFVFMIRENHSGTIMFIGKITEPVI